uniref:C2H2-type domain-containing protein n=1 Tax=Schistosoma haematobium TaxID=6185 RepID=A0A094ZN13_SCHHA
MLDSSEFMEHACQCHEFMMTASNFAEVIAKNTAMVMSSEWNKCFQSANLNNFSMNSVRNNNNNNDNNVLVKNNANNKGNSSLFQSALDLSFRSNEIPSSCDHEKDHRHYQSQQQQYQNSHRQRYNHLKQMHHLPRNHSSSSSPTSSPSRIRSSNDQYNDVSINNKTYHHKNVNLCSPYSSHGINSQNSYSHFLSNLQSLGKSYYNDTTKSSSTTLSLDSSIDSPMIELNLSNNDTYNCTTSVNSLHMSEFNTNQHINSHPAPLYHGRMEELTTDHHHDQHHRQSHQSQQNNSMNNLPPPSSSTTTSIENITDLSRPFKCCHCIKAFKSKALLDQHMHIHYPPKYTCRYCAKKYRWPPVFYHHQRTCKKRPTTSTACTNNDINNTTITVTMSTNTTHNNQHNSNNSSMKRNHHHHHHNLNYSDIRKNFPITSDSLTSLRSINSQMNDTFHNSLTSLRNPNGNLNGSETLSSYGHSLCLPPFNSNSSASLMELSNNSNIFHNNSNNNNHDDDATLMPPPHLNNFTALAAAAAAAAAMRFTNSFTSSSTATTTATSLTMVSPYHHPMNTPSPSISLPSLPTSSSSTRLQFGSNLFNQSLSSFSSINRSNLLPPFTTQSIFQSSHFVPPLLVPNSNESIDCNYLPEPSSFQPELNFPFNSVLSSIASKLTTTASSSSPMSSLSSPTKNNHAIDASNSQVNILNNLLCVCGVRFNEISSYISHISNCNFLKNLVLQSFSSTLSQSEFPVLPTTTTVTTLLSSPSSSLSSPSPPMMTSYKQTSSLFPFDTTVISNKFHPQDDVQNDDTHHEQPGKCKNSIVNNLITSNDNCNSLNETNIQQESLKHEEKINEKTNYNEISTFVQIDQLNSSKNNHETDQLHKNNIDLKESPNEPNRSPLNSLYQIENNLLSDRQITINSSNNSFITTMVNVLTNTSSMTDNQCPELQDSPCQIPKNHLNSPSQTSSFQISSSPTIDVIDHDRLDYHSQSNNSNNSPENINSISTTISTLVNSPKSCYHCGKEFSSRLSLKQHVEGKHSTEGKYCCPGCSKRYRWGASYYYHKKSCPAVREQSPVPSDIVNQLSLSGSEDNSSLSSINSPISPSKIKPTEEYNFEEKYIEGVEDEKGEEDQNCGDNDYDNDPHIEDDENENEKKEEQEDEFKHDSNNSFKLCISHKKYLRSSSRNSDLRRNSMKGSYSNKNDNLNNTSSIQSKFIKHQIQNKQICQTIKEDSLICDINAFPGYNHFIHM